MGKPRIVIFVAPHERAEAVEAYRNQLTPKEIERIMEAPDDETIKLMLYGKPKQAKG